MRKQRLRKQPKGLAKFIEWLDDKKYVGTQRKERECPLANYYREKTGVDDVRVSLYIFIGDTSRKKYEWENEIMTGVDTFGESEFIVDNPLSAKDVKSILVDLRYLPKGEENEVSNM